MPRFYLDLSVGPNTDLDPEGYEIESLLVAAIEARRTASAIARDYRLLGWHPAPSESVRVEVRDEHRQHLLTVMVPLSSLRDDPPPRHLHS